MGSASLLSFLQNLKGAIAYLHSNLVLESTNPPDAGPIFPGWGTWDRCRVDSVSVTGTLAIYCTWQAGSMQDWIKHNTIKEPRTKGACKIGWGWSGAVQGARFKIHLDRNMVLDQLPNDSHSGTAMSNG